MDQNQDKLHEALSALMDGEADELELRRILREAPANPGLLAAWKRYHVMRASLQQELYRDPAIDLLPGVQARLAAEQQEFPQGTLGSLLRSRLVRYLGQGAIAASVAAAALMGVSVLEVAYTAAPAPAIADAGTTPALNGEFKADSQSRTVALDAEARNRLQQAVYREFSEQAPEIPVNYNPEFPARILPAE